MKLKERLIKKRYYQLNLREYFEPVYRKHKTIMQIMKAKINARSNHLWPDSLFTEFLEGDLMTARISEF